MGLDMQAYKCLDKNELNGDEYKPEDWYWRKHPNLHGAIVEYSVDKLSNEYDIEMTYDDAERFILMNYVELSKSFIEDILAKTKNSLELFNKVKTACEYTTYETDLIVSAYRAGVDYDTCAPDHDIKKAENIIDAFDGDLLPVTSGFFFGISNHQDDEHTVMVCEDMLKSIDAGYKIFYDASW